MSPPSTSVRAESMRASAVILRVTGVPLGSSTITKKSSGVTPVADGNWLILIKLIILFLCTFSVWCVLY